MASPSSGFQPRNTPAERRAFFDVQRQLKLVTDTAEEAVTDDELAAAVAAGVNGTKVNLTAQTGWQVPQSGWQAKATRVGNLVIVEATVSNVSGGALTNSVITILPSNYRPPNTWRGVGIAGVTAILIQVSTIGQVSAIATINNAVSVSFDLVYNVVS